MSASINMKITALGQEALFNAKNTGFDLELTHIQFGSGNRVVDGNEVALLNARGMAPVSAGSKISATQIRVSALFPGDIPDSYPVSEIGIWAGEPGSQGAVLFAYWAKESGHIAVMSKGVEFAWTHDLFVDAAVGGSITIVVDPSASTAVTMMNAHQADPDPHSSYWNDERGGIKIKAAMSDLDMNHATAGLLPVARGGTGMGAVPVDAFLMGGADGARLIPRTPAQVSIDIGVPTTIANALHQVGLGGTDAYGGISNLDDPTLPAGLYYSRLGKAEGNWSGFGFLLHKIYDTAGFQLANVYGSGVLRFRERANNVWLKPITLANLESPAFTGTPRAVTPLAADRSTRIATTEFVAGNFPRCYSISALPNQDVGPIIVSECAEVWLWSASQYFTGYRSPLCGRPVDGHTTAPLNSEVDAVGGDLSKANYPQLWGYAQENDLLVSSTVWHENRGAYYFMETNSTQFRVPDLRNMFRRYTGVNADTATVRSLGSRQIDMFKRHSHSIPSLNLGSSTHSLTGGSPGTSTVESGAAGGAETRPMNTAFHPRIHV